MYEVDLERDWGANYAMLFSVMAALGGFILLFVQWIAGLISLLVGAVMIIYLKANKPDKVEDDVKEFVTVGKEALLDLLNRERDKALMNEPVVPLSPAESEKLLRELEQDMYG